MKMKLVSLSFVMLVGCGLFTSATPAVTTLAKCIIDDVVAGKSLAQTAIDCGADIPSVVNVLSTSTDPVVQKSPAYGEAMKTKAVFSGDAGK